MLETRLILHVKGTEAETTELPKEAVRAGISEGQISQSQLIWVSAENTWKPVRELPDLLPGEQLILHVKGTESETAKLPKQAVRAAISKGQITHSQLIWSSAENTWKQVRELPELLPSQKLAPAPARVAAPAHKAVEAIVPESPNGPVARATASSASTPHARVASSGTPTPKVHVAAAGEGPPRVQVASVGTPTPKVHVAAAGEGPPRVQVASVGTPTPKVRVATAGEGSPQAQVAAVGTPTPKVRVATAGEGSPRIQVAAVSAEETPAVNAAVPAPSYRSRVVQEKDGFNPLKWICIGLGMVILLVLAGNYFLVDRPLVSNFDQTPYSNIGVYAHFGAFIQPTVMVIHLPASAKITPDNLPDILATLAHSTPQDPITGDLFERVALTSGWTAQYSFSGGSWKHLGDMEQEAPAQLKDFLMGQIDDAGGESIMPESTLSETAQQTKRDQAWGKFIAHFTAAK